MKLQELITCLSAAQIAGDVGVSISDIRSDSRRVERGDLFVAVRGTTLDGHDYIESALEKGAAAVVCELMPERLSGRAAFIVVPDAADALGRLLDTWYDRPSARLTLVGVTGTNGKTSIATLLYELFRKLGYRAGLFSTVCICMDGETMPATHTTPDPVTLHALLAQMVQAGCEYAFMEVSSHALDQRRISGLTFAGGIFTNLTRDHLDYHQTMENYLKAKKRFFDGLPSDAFALTNADDKLGMVMLQNTAARKLTYSLRTLADFKGKIIESYFEGTELLINGREVNVAFVGQFNAYNLLAVYGAALALGQDAEETLVALSLLRPVAGRFETIVCPEGYTAIVDYAHTPDALANVLNGIREVLNGKGRILTVVGAGGNRDRGKRPLMAREACRQSNLVILTSDNPRFEEPDAIIADMAAGLTDADLRRTLCITDRMQAIKTAVQLVRKGDIILVAGKGHEDYQEIKGVKYPFDDRKILKQLFQS
ncbi:MAG: UDP-N-acetylmuramoyl-L-alanyl-D-glutamate--2,6-diaminopimelate ligase [Tannerella sp.]|jgi:UDP-N-acetylmuramoyl-L-alanyl-D-glutamate--2,6-diaminopimelate ligase|nr:UDP-N-acetylmuramoyl-L-alanyl-D-glutamate--2,6-diaminopimelate ligase [Tannerella sp.]